MNLTDLRNGYDSKEIDKHDYISNMHIKHEELFQFAKYLNNFGSDIQSIKIEKGVVKFLTRENYQFIFSPWDTRCAPIEALNFSIYESQDSKWIFRLVKDGDTIFDIGANIGWYSVFLAKNYPSSKVYSFEPVPTTFHYLQENVKLNNIHNIYLHNLALSDKNGEQKFYFEKDNTARASLANLSEKDDIDLISAKLERLDSFVSNLINLKIDFIKCDCEGAEYLVFKGGENVIASHKPIIFTEMLRKWSAKFGYHPNDILDFFKGIEYACFYSRNDSLFRIDSVNDLTQETNFIFLHESKHKPIIDKHTI